MLEHPYLRQLLQPVIPTSKEIIKREKKVESYARKKTEKSVWDVWT